MDLPVPLRQAIDAALQGVPQSAIAAPARALSERYRNEVRDGRAHLETDEAALAYVVTRLPATFAAAAAVLARFADAMPDFAPRTLLDAGAGPGTAFFAAASIWPSLEAALMIEASGPIRAWGERLCASMHLPRSRWLAADLAGAGDGVPAHDLVTLAYVLGELPPEAADRLTDRLWELAAQALVIIEPGTPSGWMRVLGARDRLLRAGAHLAAPCPHDRACPLSTPDWCHFAQRLARSRSHRTAKGAEVPFEDEKYIYLAATRRPGEDRRARVLAPPRIASGQVRLKLCQPDGTAAERHLTRREGETYRDARRLGWGDRLGGG